jgi:uncharacterized cupredoxin-like copper-binding protein
MRKLVLLAAAGLAAVVVAVPLALGSTSTVNVTLKEFKVTPSAPSAKAGKVTFKIKNTGALEHEFVVVKTSLAATKLPVKNNVVTLKPLAKVGPFKPGKGGTLSVTLKAGKYVLYCNVKGHYGFGQRIAFTVK